MEKGVGVSYPSIKNRLNKISKNFDFIEVSTKSSTRDVLDELESGTISVEDAMKELNK
jgi:hypothetical protein